MNGIDIKNILQLQKNSILILLDLNSKRMRKYTDITVPVKQTLQWKEQQLLRKKRQITKKYVEKLLIYLLLTLDQIV